MQQGKSKKTTNFAHSKSQKNENAKIRYDNSIIGAISTLPVRASE